jgi:influenza virus NS1A-binding protein
VMMPDGIYVLGGFNGNSYLKSVEKFDFNTKRWKYITDMNHNKCHFSCVTSSDYQYIYTLGGYDGRAVTFIERYDIVTNHWEVIDNLPTPNYRHQSIFVTD